MEYHAGLQDADELEALRHLYPRLSDQELQNAEYLLQRYVEIVLGIYERIRNTPVAYAEMKREVAARKQLRPTKPKTASPTEADGAPPSSR